LSELTVIVVGFSFRRSDLEQSRVSVGFLPLLPMRDGRGVTPDN
jgi:hypothetical protein